MATEQLQPATDPDAACGDVPAFGLRAVADALPVLISYVGADCRYRFNNRAYGAWFHIDNDDITGWHVRDVLGEETFALAREPITRALAGETTTYEAAATFPRGGVRHFRATYIPDRGPQGQVAGFFALVEDLTDLKAAQAALRSAVDELESRVAARTAALSEANRRLEEEICRRQRTEEHLLERETRLRTMLDASADAILTFEADGTIESFSASAERVFGYRGEEMTGRSISRLFDPPDGAGEAGECHPLMTTGRRELTGRHADGSTFPAEASVDAIRFADRQVLIAFVRDITRRKQAEQLALERQAQLSRALRLNTMGELSATLAHELNQPLAAVLSYIQGCRRMMAARGEVPADLIDFMDKAAAQAQRAGEIVGRIRKSFRREEPVFEPLDVNRIVREAADLAAIEASRQGVALTLDLDPALPAVAGDPLALSQVVLNLTNNAIDAAGTAGCGPVPVKLSTTWSADEGVVVAVRDAGPGVPPDLAARVFEPFVSGKTQGLGLGLAICQTIVRDHGGRLWMDTECGDGDRGGTTFRFTLPAVALARVPEERSHGA